MTYISLSNTFWAADLPDGGKAVYLVQPQHVPREEFPESRKWAQQHGERVATYSNGEWYLSTAPDTPVTDLKTIALLERCPNV